MVRIFAAVTAALTAGRLCRRAGRVALICLILSFPLSIVGTSTAVAQSLLQPPAAQVASALDLAAENALPRGYPPLVDVPAVPTVLLKAIAWVESRWRQFRAPDAPLVSHDGGYGVMQVTHGPGDSAVSDAVQSAIANNFVYNIACGARILTAKWAATPRIGSGDRSILEDWYYAVWAYNRWGWRNNPNNPAFTRAGTPATNPRAFPYQERVFYFVSHPPLDITGQPLWPAVPVALPDPRAIGRTPGPLAALPSPHYDAAPSDGPLLLSRFDAAQFKGDVSVPDGTIVAPDSPLHKVWLLRNAGGLFWSGYSWRHVAGAAMAAPVSVTVPFVPPLADVALGVDMVAPRRPGTYRSYWQLFDPAGHAVGAPAWIAIAVAKRAAQSGTSAPVGTATAATPLPTAPALHDLNPSPAPVTDNAGFVADLTIPDGTVLAPGQSFTKTWEIQNTGTRAWDSRYHWHFEAGAPLGTVRAVAASAVPPGGTAQFSVQMVAPRRAGTYRGFWQMTDPSGNVFGSQAWVSVRVAIARHATATPSPSPSPTATPHATKVPTTVPSPPPTATATATAQRPTAVPRPTASATPRPTASATPRPRATGGSGPPLSWFGPPVSHAYFAEGYTGNGYHEYLSLLNPAEHALHAQVAIYRADGATRLIELRLAPLARRSLDLNVLAPHASTALRVEADSRLVVERALFTNNGDVVAGAPLPSHLWYVAEGYVGGGFRDALRIFNPNALAAAVTIKAYRTDGAVLISHRIVAGGTRLNVSLDDVAPIGASGLQIAAGEPIVVESVVRSPRAAGPGAALALTAPSRRWYFPDGGTSRGNEEYMAVLNPGPQTATVRLIPVAADGYRRSALLRVAPYTRAVYVMQDLLRRGGLAAIVESDQPIVAQEVRYAGTGGESVVDGAPAPATVWGLAEGHTGDGFKQWITLLNPGNRADSVTVRLITHQGAAVVVTRRVLPHHRDYLFVDHLLPAGPVAALIASNHPIVAGRTMIFNADRGLSTTIGVPISSQ